MDLELTDEQQWLSDSVETLLTRSWTGAERAAEAGAADRAALWSALTEFGALSVDPEDGLGAVETGLVARALGTHLASVPYLGSAALRFALAAPDAPGAFAAAVTGEDAADAGTGQAPGGVAAPLEDAVSVALLEPGRGWSVANLDATVADGALTGEKVAVEHAEAVERFAVVASVAGEPALALVPARAAGIEITAQPAFDVTLPMSSVRFAGAEVAPDALVTGAAATAVLRRLQRMAGLLACAEAVGAAARLLEDARAYAAERRQFGRTIGSYQSLRHILADMYVRQSSMWSTVLYAAAALDDELEEADRTAAVAKAYVARGARDVAHGALQVFGGVAFTQEHPAHRFLRRIVVREQQFGDAAHHERELGRALAARAAAPDLGPSAVAVS
jgi:alkylation response protein AidB-like acyl-CoA dehydrogenase